MNTKPTKRQAEVMNHMVRHADNDYGFLSEWGRFHVVRVEECGEKFYELTEFDNEGPFTTWSLDAWVDVLDFLATYLDGSREATRRIATA